MNLRTTNGRPYKNESLFTSPNPNLSLRPEKINAVATGNTIRKDLQHGKRNLIFNDNQTEDRLLQGSAAGLRFPDAGSGCGGTASVIQQYLGIQIFHLSGASSAPGSHLRHQGAVLQLPICVRDQGRVRPRCGSASGTTRRSFAKWNQSNRLRNFRWWYKAPSFRDNALPYSLQ